MTRERAEELVSDLLDACVDYENATTAHIGKARASYHQKREAIIDMLSLVRDDMAERDQVAAKLTADFMAKFDRAIAALLGKREP